jgi:hypothetical protein
LSKPTLLGQLLPFRAVFLRLHLREFLCSAARPLSAR